MTDRHRQAIDDINALWGLHAYRDPDAGIRACCLALAVDRRYVEHDGQELRVGVSFGENPFPPDRLSDFDPPLPPPGRFVFGLHLLRVKANQLCLSDPWVAVGGAAGCADPAEALQVAQDELRAMSDRDYAWHMPRKGAPDVKISDRYLLEHFEIVPGEIRAGK